MAARIMSSSDGTLRAIGLVHRDLGNKVARAFRADNHAVNLAGFLHSGKKLLRGLAQIICRDIQGLIDACNLDAAQQFRMPLHKCIDIRRLGWLANKVCNVEGEEIAGSDESGRRSQR